MSPKVQCSELQALGTSIVEIRHLEIVMFDMTPITWAQLSVINIEQWLSPFFCRAVDPGWNLTYFAFL